MFLLIAVPPFLIVGIFVKILLDYYQDSSELRRFPAPSIAAFSSLWSAYHSRCLRRSRAIYDAHLALGTIVRIQPNHISFADPRAIQDIYGHKSLMIKDAFYETISGGDHENIVSTRDKQEHATKRKYVSHAFSHARVIGMEPIVRNKVQILVERLDRAAADGTSIDIRQWLNFFTFDVISQMALSYDSNFLSKGESSVLVKHPGSGRAFVVNPIKAFQDSTVHVASIGHWPSLLAITKPLTKLLRLPYSRSGDEFEDVCIHEIRTRLENSGKGEGDKPIATDFLQHLLVDSKGESRNLPFGELVQEVAVMLSAGSDTTASAMTNILYLLMKNPGTMRKLRDELDTALTDDNEDDQTAGSVAPYMKVNSLKYLRACLDEGLRVLPPTSIGLLRQTPQEGATIAGHRLKGGVTVSVPTYTIHHDPALFPEPFQYKPERWIEGTAEERQNLTNYCISFTLGRHSCLGRNIAFLEQYVVLGTLLRRYEFEFEQPDFILPVVERINANPGPMPVRVRRRQI